MVSKVKACPKIVMIYSQVVHNLILFCLGNAFRRAGSLEIE